MSFVSQPVASIEPLVEAMRTAIKSSTDPREQYQCAVQLAGDAYAQVDYGALKQRFAVPRQDQYQQYLLYHDRDFDFIMMLNYWEQGAATSVHGHGGPWAVVGVLEGGLHIQNYALHGEQVDHTVDRSVKPGEIQGVDHQGLHQIANPSKPLSASLHIYSGDLAFYRGKQVEAAQAEGAYPTRDRQPFPGRVDLTSLSLRDTGQAAKNSTLV